METALWGCKLTTLSTTLSILGHLNEQSGGISDGAGVGTWVCTRLRPALAAATQQQFHHRQPVNQT